MKTIKRALNRTAITIFSSVLLLLTACSEGTIGEPACTTGLLLTVTSSNSEVKQMVVKARNIAYEEDTINKAFPAERNIQDEPLIILIRPSSIIGEDDPFLIRAWGYDATGTQIVAGSGLFQYVPHRCYEPGTIDMRENFEDVDRDGFEPCIGAPDGTCDCNDGDARINPFTGEYCGDDVDNNCDGISEDCI